MATLITFVAVCVMGAIPAAAAPLQTARHVQVVKSPGAAATGVGNALTAQRAAAGTWVYKDTYPDPIICVSVGEIYYPGRYRCQFFWFLWQLYVYYE